MEKIGEHKMRITYSKLPDDILLSFYQKLKKINDKQGLSNEIKPVYINLQIELEKRNFSEEYKKDLNDRIKKYNKYKLRHKKKMK